MHRLYIFTGNFQEAEYFHHLKVSFWCLSCQSELHSPSTNSVISLTEDLPDQKLCINEMLYHVFFGVWIFFSEHNFEKD